MSGGWRARISVLPLPVSHLRPMSLSIPVRTHRNQEEKRLLCVTCMWTTCLRHSLISNKTSFQDDFKAYIEKLRGIVRHTCEGCQKTFCLACGESYSSTEKPRPGMNNEVDIALFHCANLQGVIIGMGLAIVQMHYDFQAGPSPSSPTLPASTEEPEKKKRKLGSVLKGIVPSIHLGPNDEDEYGGKKSRSGIGYAGTTREDVRIRLFITERFFLLIAMLSSADIWTAGGNGVAKGEGQQFGRATFYRAILSTFRKTRRRRSGQRLPHPPHHSCSHPPKVQRPLQCPSPQ